MSLYEGVLPPPKRPRALAASTAPKSGSLSVVVPDGGIKYPCVSNVVTPLNSVPDVKSLVSPGETVDPAASPVTVRVGGAAPGRPCSDAAAESALLKQSCKCSVQLN